MRDGSQSISKQVKFYNSLETSGPNATVVDVFSGAGGLSEGFRQAGYRILAGSDNDPDALATFASNFPEAKTILGDIREPETRERVLEWANLATVLVGGPPCQAFSQVRNHTRLIDDPRNSLYREFVGILRTATPPAFVMENVTGMDQMGVRDQILFDLTLEGRYKVSSQILDAADFGVPQTRKRLIFMGIRSDISCELPIPQGTGATLSIALRRTKKNGAAEYNVSSPNDEHSIEFLKRLTDENDLTATTAAQAISDLISLPVGNRRDCFDWGELSDATTGYQRLMREDCREQVQNVQVPRINKDTELRLFAVPQGGNHRDLDETMLERYLTGQKWGQTNGTGKLSRKHFYAYRRLHPSLWAWTLNTKADCVYHYSVPRALSVREMARLQSFPDRFVFVTDPRRGALAGRHDGGPAHSKYRQVGNAVPPLLAKRVATEMLTALSALFTPREIRRTG